MQTKAFNRLMLLISSTLILTITIMSWILLSQGPRVRYVTTEPSLNASSLTIGSVIKIGFDRPISQTVNDNTIKIEPEVDFRVNTSSQSIEITLLENLESDSQYTLKLAEGIYDTARNNRSAPYEYVLKTKSPSFSYLHRNYDDSVNGGALDKIYIKTLDQDAEEIFAASEIRNYTANNTHAIASVRGAENDELYIIDRRSRDISKLNLGLEGEVSILETSPRGKIVMYTVEYDQRNVSTDFYKKFSNIVYSLNTETQQTKALTDKDGNSIKASDIFMSSDGQVALIQSAMSRDFYVISPHNDYDPIYLGAHDFSFGFNQDGTKIVFVDSGVAKMFDIEKTKTDEIRIQNFGKIDISRNDLFFTQQRYSAESGLESSIGVNFDKNSVNKTVWEFDSSFGLTNITPSFDSKYVAAQINPLPCEYDTLGLASQCQQVVSKIINVGTGESREEVSGFNLIWLP